MSSNRKIGPVTIHCARWVVPVATPVVEYGAVAVAGDRIVAVGKASEVRRRYAGAVVEHGQGAILPALVNAHTHLEFTALAGRLKPTASLADWLGAAMAAMADLTPGEIMQGVRRGVQELKRYGTGLVAEVSNTGLSWPTLAASGLEFHYFYECLGFDNMNHGPLEEDFPIFASEVAGRDNFSAAAHAPYSVSPALFRRVAAWNQARGRTAAVHLAESSDERQFLQDGQGVFRRLLEQVGRWHPEFKPPGCSPTAYLDELGFFGGNPSYGSFPTGGPEKSCPQSTLRTPNSELRTFMSRTLAVHGVWLSPEDRQLLAARDVWVVLCPRSNRHTGAGFPDLPRLAAEGVKLALGTDSLASVADFNLFADMVALLRAYPDFPPLKLITMATLEGARALGREAHLGSIAPGKKAALLFIPVEATSNFWPALLHAGAAGHLRWLQSSGGS